MTCIAATPSAKVATGTGPVGSSRIAARHASQSRRAGGSSIFGPNTDTKVQVSLAGL